MPDAELIGALDELRERYGQRQRQAANLLAALKGLNGALGKAGKSLREYSERAPGAAEGLVSAEYAAAAIRGQSDALMQLADEQQRPY